MAYNPFDFFRRNQKLFFGGLTILVMFMFILSFGQGDFFSWFPQWIAKFQTTGDVMAKIDGSTIKESQLSDVGRERTLANGYMLQAASKAIVAAHSTAEADVAAANPDLRQQLSSYLAGLDQALTLRLTPEQAAEVRIDVARQIVFPLVRLEDSTPKTEDKKRVKAVRVYADLVMGELARRGSSERSDGGVYFANQPNRTDRDRLDFLLWKKKADQLGIRYTHEDVADLVNREFPSSALTKEELGTLATKVASDGRMKNTGELYDALADEFRVRAAQTAVLGVSEVRNPADVPVGTAQERYEHFVTETTATKYSFLTIPVDAYLSQVQGEPTEAELTKIFNERSSTDPDPASPNPGIREPRKVGVQWVELTGNEDYYKALAARRVLAVPQAQAVLGPALTSVAPAFATYEYDEYVKEQAGVTTYRQQKFNNPGRPALGKSVMGAIGGGLAVDPNSLYWFGEAPMSDRDDRLLDVELATPELAAALAGLTAGGFATHGLTFPAPTAAVNEVAYRQSREKRVIAGIRAVQFPTLPGLAGFAEATGGATAALAASPAPLPQTAVQSVLDKRTADQLRAVVATEDVKAFADELAKIMKTVTDKSPAAEKAAARAKAAEYVTKWVAERGLKSGATTEPRSVHTLADDPGLAPLLAKEILLTDFGGKPKNSRAATLFGQAFVNETEIQITRTPQGQFQPAARMKPASGLYVPRDYNPSQMRQNERQEYAPLAPGGFFGGELRVSGDARTPLTMVWRTAEVDAVRPLSLASDPAARERAKAIWKMNKARQLARDAAAKAAETIRKGGANELQVGQYVNEALDQLRKPFADNKAAADRFLAYDQAPTFTTAKLLLSPGGGVGAPPMVSPFNPTHPAVVYDDAGKVREELLAHKDDEVGTTFVIADQPQTTLFLTVVAGKETKGEFLFNQYVLNPTNPFPPGQGFLPLGPDVLAPRFAAYEREADRKLAVALLKAEFKVKDENPKLDEKQ